MAAWGYKFYRLVLKVSLTHSLRSLVRDQHSKIKFVPPHGHVISSIYSLLLFFFFTVVMLNKIKFSLRTF